MVGDAQREVHALFDQVDAPIIEVDVDTDVRMGLGKLQDQRRQVQQAETQRHRGAYRAAQGLAFAGQITLGGVDAVEDLPTLFEIGRAGRCQ